MLVHSIMLTYKYEQIPTMLENALIENNSKVYEAIERDESKDKVLKLAASALKSTEMLSNTKGEFIKSQYADIQRESMLYSVFSGVATILSIMLLFGVSPMFKKASNN